MNGFHCLLGGIYHTACEFASLEGFRTQLEDRFSDLPFDQVLVIERAERLVEEFERPTERIDNDCALLLLLARDLRRIVDVLRRIPIPDPESSLLQHRDRFEAVMRDLGLDFSPPKLFIVDSFPRPYDTMDWVATSPDAADQRQYGIEPGNYFKRQHLVPYGSDVLLAHEMTHQVIGEVDPDWLARGLEEGIAVVFGELFVGARVMGKDVARAYARHQWFDRRAAQANRLYIEYARIAALIYHRYGLDGLLALVQSGRRKIKEIERSCLRGDFALDLPRGGWDDAYSDLVAEITMATIGDSVVNPLAKYIAEFVSVGATVDEIAHTARVTAVDVVAALEQIQHQAVLIMVDGDRVDYSDLDIAAATRTLRYRV